MTSLRRRSFNAGLTCTALGMIGLNGAAQAQPAGRPEFRLIKPERTPDVDKGKIEVIEFFWYGCPHCNALEPSIREWLKRQPADVAFRKVHVPFREEKHQQLYYALDSLGKTAELNDKVFHAIHVERLGLDSNKQIIEWAAKQGIDAKLMEQTLESFGVKTKMKKATNLATEHGVDGVPALTVHGRFYTAPSMAGSNGAALRLVDQFIDQVRKGGK